MANERFDWQVQPVVISQPHVDSTSNLHGRRILLITRNLPPLVGGMERLNWHMAAELSGVAEVRIIGPNGSATLAPLGVMVREVPLKPLWRFLLGALALACREARAWHPDIVLAGSGLTAPIARVAARTCGAKTVMYAHGLDVAVKHAVYRAVWLPAIRCMDRVIANSRPTAELCRQIDVQPERVDIVHPGVDLPDESQSPVEVETFKACHGLGKAALLLSVGRLSARKGLREFVTHALPRIVAAQPNVVLLIVGDAPSQALHATAQTPQSIQAAADAIGMGSRVKFLGTITNYAELGIVYRAADVHVFPVRHIPDDPEGFGMVAVEAAAHGLPTVAFATGGIVEAVAEGQSGHVVPTGDYDAFADAVVRTLDERGPFRAMCMEFADQFVWRRFGVQITSQLANVITGPSS